MPREAYDAKFMDFLKELTKRALMVEYAAKKSVILDRILKDTNDQDDLSAHEYAAD